VTRWSRVNRDRGVVPWVLQIAVFTSSQDWTEAYTLVHREDKECWRRLNDKFHIQRPVYLRDP
jgi:hypothetical protein